MAFLIRAAWGIVEPVIVRLVLIGMAPLVDAAQILRVILIIPSWRIIAFMGYRSDRLILVIIIIPAKIIIILRLEAPVKTIWLMMRNVLRRGLEIIMPNHS